MNNDKTCSGEEMAVSENNDFIVLSFAVWQKVFSSPLYNQIIDLFKQIFKSDLVLMDIVKLCQEDKMQLFNLLKRQEIRRPDFCKLISNSEEGKKRCLRDGEQVLKTISSSSKIEIGVCHAGLTEMAAPIMIQNTYCGCLSTEGGLLLHKPNQTEFIQITERVKNIELDLELLKKAYFELTPISPELFDIMLKFINIAIGEIIKTATEIEEAKQEIIRLNHTIAEKYHFANIIGKSKPMQDIFHLLEIVTQSEGAVFIQGETGTGKELVARAIHYNSPRKDKPFVTQNCAALSESLLESELFGHIKGAFTGAISDKRGLFEQANHGTLFLDEIGDMSLGMQAKLLRVIEDGEIRRVGDEKVTKVDVRIISATNKDIKTLTQQNKFREDLYYRIQGFNIHLPTLRERKEDIPLLIEHFLSIIYQDKKKKLEVDNEALKLLINYDWPGNVRELDSEIQRVATLSKKIITPDLLSREIKKIITKTTASGIWKEFKGKSLEETMNNMEKELIIQTLKESNLNKASAARLLNIPWSTLDSKIKKYGLDKNNISR